MILYQLGPESDFLGRQTDRGKQRGQTQVFFGARGLGGLLLRPARFISPIPTPHNRWVR